MKHQATDLDNAAFWLTRKGHKALAVELLLDLGDEGAEKEGVEHFLSPHAFGSTRIEPLGVRDSSLRFCDSCGQGFNHWIHDVPNSMNIEAIIEAIER